MDCGCAYRTARCYSCDLELWNCSLGEHSSDIVDFYRVLQSVIELIYRPRRHIVLFECKWFDINARKRRIQVSNHLTSINVQRFWYKNDPYIFYTQARSVIYISDPKLGTG